MVDLTSKTFTFSRKIGKFVGRALRITLFGTLGVLIASRISGRIRRPVPVRPQHQLPPHHSNN